MLKPSGRRGLSPPAQGRLSCQARPAAISHHLFSGRSHHAGGREQAHRAGVQRAIHRAGTARRLASLRRAPTIRAAALANV